jgi:3-deoxy-D-arabino-heptulosonate 7-phosphate (DAHP) synthase class II
MATGIQCRVFQQQNTREECKLYIYLMLIFVVVNGVHIPQANIKFDDSTECLAAAENIMKDKTNKYHAACMPLYLDEIQT